MTAFLKSIFLAALLCAGTAYAQSDTADNPHSTKAKDKQGTDTPNSVTNQQTQAAETANPHSTDHNKAEKPSGNAHDQMQQADKENPNDINYRDRKQNQGASATSGSGMDHEQMGMDHEMAMKNATPQMMLQRLHMANQEEIQMGKLAEQNGTDRIKSYAKTLQQDHQSADRQVQDLAKKKSVNLSDTPKNPQMQQRMQQMHDRFSSLKGAEFDRAFTNMMSNQHKRLIDMAQAWSQNAKDQDVKGLLDQMLPKLQQHAQMADQLRTPAAQGRSPDVR